MSSGVAVVESLSSSTSTKVASCTIFSQGEGGSEAGKTLQAVSQPPQPFNAQDMLLPPTSSMFIAPQLIMDLDSKKTPGIIVMTPVKLLIASLNQDICNQMQTVGSK